MGEELKDSNKNNNSKKERKKRVGCTQGNGVRVGGRLGCFTGEETLGGGGGEEGRTDQTTL